MTYEDQTKLNTQAIEFNQAINDQEGYDPVAIEWIMKELVKAYWLGWSRAANTPKD